MTEEAGATATDPVIDRLHGGVLLVEQGGRGGVADYTACLAGALAERGIPVTIATARDHRYPRLAGVKVAPMFAYVRGHTAPARAMRRLGLGKVMNGLRFLGSLVPLYRLARRYPVAHVQGWETPSLGLLATLVLRISGTHIVYTAHNTFERTASALDGARIFPALARQTIVHTAGDRERIARPTVLIPHGNYTGLADAAPAIEPAAARRALDLPDDVPVVLLFGVLRPDKGLSDLLEALLLAPDWHAVIAGEEDGALAGAADLLSSSQLVDRLTVREGFQEMPAVGAVFAACDLVALPYRIASQSGVLHLAYGFCRPVVAYPVGGLPDAVRDGETGWVCARPSPAALADVLNRAGTLGREEMRRRGVAARQFADNEFGWSEIAAATQAVYRAALAPDAP